MVDDVTIGHKVDADGTIATADQGDDFAPGEPIHIVDEGRRRSRRLEGEGRLVRPGRDQDRRRGEDGHDRRQVPDFEQTKTASWPKGDYRAEIWIGDEKVNHQQFNITDKADAGK